MKPTSALTLAALALLCACQDHPAQRTPTGPEAPVVSPAAPSSSAAAEPTGNTVCDTYTDRLASLRAESAPDAEEVAAYEAMAADACDN